jgi:hypothetical protein
MKALQASKRRGAAGAQRELEQVIFTVPVVYDVLGNADGCGGNAPAFWRARRSCAARLRSASPRRPLPGWVVWAGGSRTLTSPLSLDVGVAACLTVALLSASALAAAVSANWRALMRATSLLARKRCSLDTSPVNLRVGLNLVWQLILASADQWTRRCLFKREQSNG